jgi:hypothetical protein
MRLGGIVDERPDGNRGGATAAAECRLRQVEAAIFPSSNRAHRRPSDHVQIGAHLMLADERNVCAARQPFFRRERWTVQMQRAHAEGQHHESALEILRSPEPDDLAWLIEEDKIGDQAVGAIRGEQAVARDDRERRVGPVVADPIDRAYAAKQRPVEHGFAVQAIGRPFVGALALQSEPLRLRRHRVAVAKQHHALCNRSRRGAASDPNRHLVRR